VFILLPTLKSSKLLCIVIVNNDLKMVFTYNINLKELKANLNIHSNYYFNFFVRDIMLERENKEMQCSSNLCYVYIFQC
jgi:hypothetical protein